MTGRRPGPGGVSAAAHAAARSARARLAAAGGVAVLLAVLGISGAARAEEPPPLVGPYAGSVPVVRPSGQPGSAQPPGKVTIPLLPLWKAEGEYRSGDAAKALSLFLDLAYNFPDDERKGFVWLRVADLLLGRGEIKQALEAADKAIHLTGARFLVLSAMELKYRMYLRMDWKGEVRQVAAYLLDQGYINAEPSDLLAEMARADASEGRMSLALSEFRRAIAAADPENASRLAAERDALINGMTSIPVLWEAAEAEEDPGVRSHLHLALGRIAVRKGFPGMGAFALERAARWGGVQGEEAARQLARLDTTIASRPKIVGLVPLSGKYAGIGFAVLAGAEVALLRMRGREAELLSPVIRWTDTGGQADRARSEFQAVSFDRSVAGIIGPLTGEEGHSVSVAFGPKSPPVLYLGQKRIPEKPFLFSFGLTPQQEARAVLSRLANRGAGAIFLFHPENGYGRGFADAAASAAAEAGVRVARTVPYPPDTTDFTDVIRKAVGSAAFSRHSAKREKGAAMKLPVDAILIADRWDRVFLLASQLRYYNVYLPLAGFSGWNDEELIRKAGDAVNGSVFSVDYSGAVPGSPGERFRKEYQDSLERPPSRFEAMGYDAAFLLAESFGLEPADRSRPAGDMTRESLPRIKTFRGVTGTFQFGPAGEMRRKVSLLNVEHGNFVPVPEM